jgi:molecular chaperone HtpG
MFTAEDVRVAVFEKPLDVQFLSMVESYGDNVKYIRIDADVAGALKSDEEAKADPTLAELFVKVSDNEKLKVEFSALKDAGVPLVLTVSEESRRMEEMMKLYAMSGMAMPAFPTEATLTVNTTNALITRLSDMDDDKRERTASYLYQLALLSQRKLSAEELQRFLSDSYTILGLI